MTVDYSTEMEHDGLTYAVKCNGLEILRCENCQAEELPDESYRKLVDALRGQASLLLPSQITAKREALHLSQKEFARLLGVAAETVCRWENGGQLQQRVMNDFMKAFFALPDLRKYLGQIRGLVPTEKPRSPVNWKDTETSEAGEVPLISTPSHSATSLEFASPFSACHEMIVVR